MPPPYFQANTLLLTIFPKPYFMAHDYSVTTNSFQEDSPPPLTTLYLSSAEDT